MPKEDRSDWVAVAPQFAAASSSSDPVIRKAQTAFQFFQKDVAEIVKAEIMQQNHGVFDIAVYTRAMRSRWHDMPAMEQEPYQALARQDAARFARASQAADAAALARHQQQQEQQHREAMALLLDSTVEGSGGGGGGAQRATRKGMEKKRRKMAKKQAKLAAKRAAATAAAAAKADGQELPDGEESHGSFDSNNLSSDSSSSDDDDGHNKTKKAEPKPLTEKQRERQQQREAVKAEQQAYIAARQQEVRQDKAQQAKLRLEYLLQQSDIFSHFGSVRAESAKLGIGTTKAAVAASTTTTTTTPTVAGAARRAAAAVDDADKDAADLAEADEHEATFLTAQPTTLGFGQMRDYQLEGLNWMIRLQENGVNGILADEMGLGKTLQSISILLYMQEYRDIDGPHLVIVPKSTLSNWMNEFKRWAPTLTVVKFHGTKEEREAIVAQQLVPAHQRDEHRTWHVVVTTYEVCNIERNALSKFAWSYLVIDEAHRLKNDASTFSRTVRTFETRYRILLTGTPLQNSLLELFALLNFLVPDVFESAEQFDEWFNLDIDDYDEKNKLISQLHKILRPFMLRRLKADVEKSLPPKHETILFTGMSAMQKKLYRDILIRDIDAIQGNSGSRTAVLNIVMQLRKCAGHPYLFPGVEDRTLPPLGEHLIENCGKMVVLDKLLKRLKERGHRVLLFTQMTRILDIMEDYLRMRQFSYCRIDGNTSYEDREDFIDAFNAEGSTKFIFLLSTRAGGLGINLQTADVVILYDSDWNPQADLQAQDRAHRIGQKRPVQVFRLVTEHTVEEKIVERAQQKLKLDAMVVQQGRLKDKDKLSRDELLTAVRFGADRIFKSKDSSITDDDIDYILDQGRQKTEAMNEKLKVADKGDLLDFKLDGSSVQMFEGVDYSSSALAQMKAHSDMLGLFDIGKRERKEANYNETLLYQQQVAALQARSKPKKKKDKKLPKHLRLPRMEEWQMYDRSALQTIQEEEEAAFKNLPEDVQKFAITGSKPGELTDMDLPTGEGAEPTEAFEMPPLLSEERLAEKERLLSEGFGGWNRLHYQAFWKASAVFGRDEIEKVAADVGKPIEEVQKYTTAFWGEWGRTRIAEHEYERAVKYIERGEKRIEYVKSVERGTSVLVSLFDNPWAELEFTHVNCKDKMFTAEEDRFLLCWAYKFGYGQWMAIRFAIRRCPNFRFDYFLRSLPVELLGRRCDQLMKAAKQEVEALERQTREAEGLPTDAEDGQELPQIVLPKFRVLRKQISDIRKQKHDKERRALQDKVDELEEQIKHAQDRLKALNSAAQVSVESTENGYSSPVQKAKSLVEESDITKSKTTSEKTSKATDIAERAGAVGPDGLFLAFPDYDGSEEPLEWKKPFTHFCNKTRREIKDSLDAAERKNKKKVNGLLKERWLKMSADDRNEFHLQSEWDRKRYEHELDQYHAKAKVAENQEGIASEKKVASDADQENASDALHVPKKRRSGHATPEVHIPKDRQAADEGSIPKKRRR